MPTVLRSGGVRIVIYHNDHSPAHVHVIGPGWVVVVNLFGPDVREVIGCGQREAARAKQLIAENRMMLLAAWRRIHG